MAHKKLTEKGKKMLENKKALVEQIVDNLQANEYDSREYIFDLVRESLMTRTQAYLKRFIQPE